MPQCISGSIQRMHILQIFFCMLLAVVSSGCSKIAPPSLAAAPGFAMPAAGASTDSVLRIGDPFPQLQAVDLDGNAVTVDKQLLGERYTLIVFWSTWCGFCMLDLPHEVELAKQYQRLGLRVIGVNADETSAIAKAAAQEYDVPWLNLFEGPDRTISNELGIRQWPALLLLDSNGKVVITSPDLRSISAETLPDGTDRQIDGLEWALRELLETK
jgi:cytochrome c biogenesis protein CcmG, thiol:disulfide interchange protein DsbE